MNGADYITDGEKNNDNQHPERSLTGRRACCGRGCPGRAARGGRQGRGRAE